MSVVKYDERIEPMSLDKITARIKAVQSELPTCKVNVMAITMGVVENISNEIETSRIDKIAINIIMQYANETDNACYRKLAIGIFKSWCVKYVCDEPIETWEDIQQMNFSYVALKQHIQSSADLDMYVIGRDGKQKLISLDEITNSIKEHATNLRVNPMSIVIKTIEHMGNKMTTCEIDEISAWMAATYSITNPDYEKLASRLELTNLYKSTPDTFSKCIETLAEGPDSIIRQDVKRFVEEYFETLNNACIELQSNDYLLDYFAVKTMKKIYLLLDTNGNPIERPQYTWMRIAVELYMPNIQSVIKCFKQLSNLRGTHASPTIFNSCTTRPQLSSCMLLTNEGDSVEGIYETRKKCAQLGAATAGIGVSLDTIRATGSMIKSSRRPSRGVPSFIRGYDSDAEIIDQGGKRKMSLAIYMQPWHADFLTAISMSKPTAKAHMQAHNLFFAAWHNTLLYKRVQAKNTWSFFCPTKAPKLLTTYGKEFDEAYEEYEKAGLASHTMPAVDVYRTIAEVMYESGRPYNLNKDACNEKSNLKNVHIINCSNLCAEILIPSGEIDGENEIGVCMLNSINLSKHVKTPIQWVNGTPNESLKPSDRIDWTSLEETTRSFVRNLNQVIDRQQYILPECERSSLRHRPIGVGFQGLGTVFFMCGLPFDSSEANELQHDIMDFIARMAVDESCELAKIHGSYETFEGSPASMGKLQPHLWRDYYATHEETYINGAPRTDVQKLTNWQAWDELAEKVKTHGLRNSLITALMPTGSTSQLTGNTPTMEPQFSNVYSRHGLIGNFFIVNKYLIEALSSCNLWNEEMKSKIINNNGSVQSIPEIPNIIKVIFKTAHEISQKQLMFMSAVRGQYICQTQSLNLFIRDPTISKLITITSHGMKLGLKTISYYAYTEAASSATKIEAAPESAPSNSAPSSSEPAPAPLACVRRKQGDPPSDCQACSA